MGTAENVRIQQQYATERFRETQNDMADSLSQVVQYIMDEEMGDWYRCSLVHLLYLA